MRQKEARRAGSNKQGDSWRWGSTQAIKNEEKGYWRQTTNEPQATFGGADEG